MDKQPTQPSTTHTYDEARPVWEEKSLGQILTVSSKRFGPQVCSYPGKGGSDRDYSIQRTP